MSTREGRKPFREPSGKVLVVGEKQRSREGEDNRVEKDAPFTTQLVDMYVKDGEVMEW